MKTINRLLVAGIVALLACLPLTAQTSLNSTTLSAAVTDASARTVTVGSTTGITAPGTGTNQTYLLVDKEIMDVRAVNTTSGVVTVVRGAIGTRAATHVSAATVWVAPPGAIQTFIPSGQCQRTLLLYVPLIVGGTGGLGSDVGSLFDCLGVTTAGQWTQTFPTQGNIVYGSTVASASSITPTGTMFTISGTTTINTITVPSGWGPGMCLAINPSGLWATGTSGNINIATTAVVNKLLFECYDSTTAKWSPSY